MRKLNQSEMMNWIESKGVWCRKGEDYKPNDNDFVDTIWMGGEDRPTIGKNPLPIYDYYSYSEQYGMGVLNHWRDMLKKRGWDPEWLDCGTVFLYAIEDTEI